MSTNPYFKNFNSPNEQAFVEGFILESIKIYGHDVKYIPRAVGDIDKIFGEASNSSFNQAAVIEAYIKNIEGYGGQGRFLTQFGLEIRDKITFTISKLRFDQIKTNKLLTENGGVLQLEGKPSYTPNSSRSMIVEGVENPFSIDFPMPRIGDLIYMPMTDKIFEIKYVNYESLFYQFGSLQVYDLECELFEYSNEEFNTGDASIDKISDTSYKIILEDNTGSIKLEQDEGLLLLEQFLEDNPTMNNFVFTNESESVIDWSQKSPLIDYNENGKW